tara:strand:+ start:29785 stop:30489 length:705 start_codon:yes stop_codon:yes gene_type:complete
MSESDDDWETADIQEGTFVRVDTAALEAAEREARERENALEKAKEREKALEAEAAEVKRLELEKKAEQDKQPVLLVDFTSLDPEVHNRADKHAVSDAKKASALRKKIEADYETYANDATMKEAGTVRASTRETYLQELAKLRERSWSLLLRLLESLVNCRRLSKLPPRLLHTATQPSALLRGHSPPQSSAHRASPPNPHGRTRQAHRRPHDRPLRILSSIPAPKVVISAPEAPP